MAKYFFQQLKYFRGSDGKGVSLDQMNNPYSRRKQVGFLFNDT